MNQLKSIVIGAGSAGSQRADGNHAAAFVNNPKSVLLGIFDSDQDLDSDQVDQELLRDTLGYLDQDEPENENEGNEPNVEPNP